jgi:hypothetical protein
LFQDLDNVDPPGAGNAYLLFGDLFYQLERSDPPVSPIAVFGYLFIVELDVKGVSKELANLVVCKKKIITRDDQNGRLCPPFHYSQRRQVACRDHQMDKVRRVLQQPVDKSMHDRVSPEVMVIVQNEDERLLDALQYLINEQVNSALRVAEQFFVRLRKIIEDRAPEIRHYVRIPCVM